MATHDYIISNASGAAVRADLNNALAAIATNNSSATEPTTTYAYQWWADTGSSPTVMKLRNAANSGWITLFQLDGEWTVVPFENGTAAAPSIYFKDSGTDTGIYSPGTDQVAITTGGTARLYVGSTGAVGIGTTSVNTTLEVLNSSTPIIRVGDGTRHMELRGGSTTQNAAIGTNYAGSFDIIQNGGAAVTIDTSKRVLVGLSSSIESTSKLQVKDGSLNIYHASAAAGAGYAIFFTSDGSSSALAQAKIEGLQEAANTSGGRLVFSTSASGSGSPTERMRIASDGSATFYYGQRWADRGTSKGVVTPDFRLYNTTSNTFVIDNYTVGVQLVGGATAWTTFSDERQKTNLQPIENGLSKISTLRAVTGRYLVDAEDVSRSFLIAQDVQAVLPEAVSVDSDEDGTLGLRYTEVIPLLVAALKESKERIEQLEAKVAALETQ